MVALTLAPNEEQLLAALDDGGLWALDLTRLNSLPVCHLPYHNWLLPYPRSLLSQMFKCKPIVCSTVPQAP